MAADTASDVSSEYASILGAKPEKYQTKVLLFQVSFCNKTTEHIHPSLHKDSKCKAATLAGMGVPWPIGLVRIGDGGYNH